MKRIHLLAVLVFCLSPVSGQEMEAWFSAMIVRDLDSSIQWYSNVLGFEVVNRTESTERGFRQSNLKREGALLEIIELKGALDPEVAVPGYAGNTRLIGLFKTGFRVTGFDEWMTHIEDRNAKFLGSPWKDSTTGKRMAIITDPDGNRIQIIEM